MRQNNNAKHGENDDEVQRQVDLYGGLSAHAGRSKDPALVRCNQYRIIVFWKRYFTLLPWIASLARKVLSSVATIAAAERVFRGAGLIVPAMVSTMRNSMLAQHHVNKIIFIHNNYKLIKALKESDKSLFLAKCSEFRILAPYTARELTK